MANRPRVSENIARLGSETIQGPLDLWLASRSATVLAATILGLAIFAFWCLPLRSSLWIDEIGTAWAVHGTLRETWARAFDPGQASVLFSILTWCVVKLGGMTETALRLPSLIATSVAAIGVYMLARRYSDPHESLIASALFATHRTVAFAAADARPYALGLMAVVWSILTLIWWCETRKFSHGVAAVLLVALSIYTHYLSATIVPLYAWYLIQRNASSRPKRSHITALLLLLVTLLLLLLPHATHLWNLREEHTFSNTPSIDNVIDAIFYSRLVFGIVIGLLVAHRIWRPLSLRTGSWFTRSRGFLLAWYLGPILFLGAVSMCSSAKLFVPRYYAWGVPGLAILVASSLSCIDYAPARRTVGLIILLTFCTRRAPAGPAAHNNEDWRGALRAVRIVMASSDYSLLLRSGFPERTVGSGAATLENPLMAPLAMYPVPGKTELAPFSLEGTDRGQWEEVVSSMVKRSTGFVFVSSQIPVIEMWLLGRMHGENYRISKIEDFVGITVILFEPRVSDGRPEAIPFKSPHGTRLNDMKVGSSWPVARSDLE